MKVFCLIAFLASVSCAFAGVQRQPRLLEDQIIGFIDCFREIARNGDEELGLPPLDPLLVESASSDLAVDVGVAGLSGVATVTNTNIVGLLGFVYNSVKGEIGLIPPRYTLSADLGFPNIVADIGGYDVDIVYTAVDLHIWGAGAISFDAVNFQVVANLAIYILGGIEIRNVSVRPALQGLNSIKITGLYNDEEFSAQLTADFLNDPSGTLARYSDTVNAIAVNLVAELATDLDTEGDSVLGRCL